MQGLEICKKYFYEYGLPMLKTEFSEVIDYLAVGLIGEGSECLGYDDALSQDHDFEPGFCIFITKEDYQKYGFKLERAYAKLPKEFLGYKRNIVSAVGGNRHGVIILEDFLQKFLGVSEIPDDNRWWLFTPSQSLLTITSGELFLDNLGVLTKIRQILLNGYPNDIKLKKLAGHTIFMAQAGQYNYSRLVERGEYGSAQLAIFEFVKNAISVIYLLNNKYEPFYKWVYRGMRDLEILGELESALVGLTEIENSSKTIQTKIEIIEDISSAIINQFKIQGITKATCNNLETHAYSLVDGIKDSMLRNMHIMEGV